MTDDTKTGNGTDPNPLAIDTLSGDIRDAVLTEFKMMPKPWQQMNEEEQERIITRAEDIGKNLVAQAVSLIAARGLPVLPITVGKFTVDAGEIKGTFGSYASDDNLIRVRHLADRRALFVLADPAEYDGERAPAEPDNVGDLALPKSGPGAPSDPAAMEQLGRGKAGAKPPKSDLARPSTANPPFNAADDEAHVTHD